MTYKATNIEDGCSEPDCTGDYGHFSVEDAIHGADWIHSDEATISFVIRSYANDMVSIDIPRNDVSTFDARIPNVIDALLADSVPYHEMGSSLRDTIEHWGRDHFILEDAEEGPSYIHSFQKIYPYSGEDYVTAEVFMYQTKKTADGIEYCPSGDYVKTSIPCSKLEEHFPGAINRLHTAQAFGYNDRDLVGFVIPEDEAPEKVDSLPSGLEL